MVRGQMQPTVRAEKRMVRVKNFVRTREIFFVPRENNVTRTNASVHRKSLQLGSNRLSEIEPRCRRKWTSGVATQSLTFATRSRFDRYAIVVPYL